MKLVGFMLIVLTSLSLPLLLQGCASVSEQDIYGSAIEEIVEGVDTGQTITLSEENKSLKEEISRLENEKKDLEKKIASLQENNAQLSAKLSNLGAQLEAEKQKNRTLSQKILEYESQPKPGATEIELRNEIAKRDSEIVEYKRQIRDLQAKLAEIETRQASEPTISYPGIFPNARTIKMTEEQFRNYYNLGLNSFRNRRYRTAIAYFDTLLRSDLETDLKINAIYWIGESYFGLKQYQKAIEYFNYVAQTKTVKTPDAIYMLGRCYEMLGDTRRAREYMNQVLREYPQTPVAKKAKERLAKL